MISALIIFISYILESYNHYRTSLMKQQSIAGDYGNQRDEK